MLRQSFASIEKCTIPGLLLALVFVFFQSANANDLPRCADSWEQRNLHNYSFKDDTVLGPDGSNVGYENYQDRVADLSRGNRKNCKKRWTILVYMAANNDLSPYALWDLYEMEAGFSIDNRSGSSLAADLLVDVQTAQNKDLRRYHMFQSYRNFDEFRGLDYYKRAKLNSLLSPIAYQKPERTGSIESQLQSFVEWGINNYPAENYMVIVWGHGQGFTSLVDTTNPESVWAGRFGGLAFQEESNDYLTTPALARALKKAQANTGQKISVYASDACLMQMLEVSYEIADSAKYVIGSSQIQTYLGFPYRTMMYEVNKGRYSIGQRADREILCGQDSGVPKKDRHACLMSHLLPKVTRRSVNPLYGYQGIHDKGALKKFTISSLSTESLNRALVPFMNKMSVRMLDLFEAAPETIEEIRMVLRKSLRFVGDGVEVTSSLLLLNKYLLEYIPTVPRESEEQMAARRLLSTTQLMLETFTKLSVAASHGEAYQLYLSYASYLGVVRLGGFSIWIPRSHEEIEERIDDFNQSRLYKELRAHSGTETTLWEQWLRVVYPNPEIPLR